MYLPDVFKALHLSELQYFRSGSGHVMRGLWPEKVKPTISQRLLICDFMTLSLWTNQQLAAFFRVLIE
uniref:Uncharacterized protein n=1 Tax=Ditylenchus dipsaci TaxID=166011 RepID=A0A915E2I4_9BILA